MAQTNNSFPLTLTQEDIYFDQVKNITSPFYNVGGFIDIKKVNLEKLSECHRQLVSNSETFGIRLSLSSEGISQYICDDRNTDLTVIDFSSETNPAKAADLWLKRLFEQPIEVIEADLYRAYVLKLSENAHRYVGFAHHLAMDGWGFANWANKLGKLYNGINVAFDSQQDWRDVVLQDREYLSSKKFQLAKEYWSDFKHENTAFLERYYQSKFNQHTNIPSERVIAEIDPRLFTRIQQLAESTGTGIPHLLLAILTSYLGLGYSKDAITVGLPFHNRKNFLQKHMLGVFTSVSPLNIDIDFSESFLSLVKDIGRRQKAHFRHQRYPITQLVQSLGQKFKNDKLFDVGFNYLKLDSQMTFDDEPAHLVYLSHNHVATPLMLTAWEYGEHNNIELQLDYNLCYFEKQEAESLLVRFKKILTQVLANPEIAISEIEIYAEIEKDALQYSPSQENQQNATLLTLFERQVREKPHNIAVSDKRGCLTYQQLNNRSNALATEMLGNGVKPGDRVGIHLQRSVDILSAILAIFKCGGAYVPLDPAYPEQRIQFFAQDSGCQLVLTNRGHQLDGIQNLEIEACLGQLDHDIAVELPEIQVSKDNIAYLIYTSGSTGTPKAVQVTQSNVSALIHWGSVHFNSKELQKVLASTSLNFDISVFELLLPITLGYQSVIVENALSLLTESPDVSLLNSVPSAVRTLMENGRIPESVITINCAGEQLALDLLNGLLAGNSCQAVNNLYGPTEDTVYSTCKKFTEPQSKLPDIGQPILGTCAYIVSAQGTRLPHGLAGELVLSGKGVAHGYFNRDALTAASFVDNCFDNLSSKMYRTGDIVRQLANGDLQYLGRKDQQTKLRGFRIEPGEIEYQLTQIDGIRAAIVTAFEKSLNAHFLVAYIVFENKSLQISEAQKRLLKEKLTTHLPEYMIPSDFIALEEFPLNSNGKIDRKKLPEVSSFAQRNCFSPPTTSTETALVENWAELFDVETDLVDVEDDFFAAGGHSLLAVKFAAGIGERLNITLPIDSVFKYRSIRELAKKIDASELVDELPEIEAVDRNQNEHELSAAQARIWFLSQLGDAGVHYNMPVALSFNGNFDYKTAEYAINKVIARHASLRTIFKENSGEPVQNIVANSQLSLTLHDLTSVHPSQQPELVTQLIRENTEYRFDLTEQVAFVGAFILLSEEGKEKVNTGVLLLNFHHIIADGVSLGIFAREFSYHYKAAVEKSGGLAATEQELNQGVNFEYIDYPGWQSQCRGTEQFKRHLDYWKQQLLDAPSIHGIPLDHPRPTSKKYSGGKLVSEVSKETIASLATKFAVSPFMLIHGVLALVLASHGNSRDIVIGTPFSNRLKPGFKNLIGLFVNTLALRTYTDFSTLIEYFRHIKETHVDAQSHQLAPFDEIINELNIEKSTAYNPLFQIMLSLEDDVVNELEIPEVHFDIVESLPITAKFDLDISVKFNEKSLSINWVYDLSLFDESRIRLISEHFGHLLASIEKHPDAKIAELNMLSQAEITSFQEHFIPVDVLRKTIVEPSIIDCFEAMALQYPHNIAVICGDEKLSYRDLNRRAENMSISLKKQGVKAGEVVAVGLERSVELIVAIIAIYKSGAAYLPLDTTLPQNRLRFILQNSGAVRLIISEKTSDSFNGLTDDQNEFACHRLVLHANDSLVSLTPKHGMPQEASEGIDASGNTPAYVIYTSGTSGEPKGVVVAQRALSLHIQSVINYFDFKPQDCVLQLAAFSFDTFAEQVFAALCSAASIVLAPKSLIDPPTFFELAKNNKVTITDVSVAYLEELLHDDWRQHWAGSDINRIVVGGEALGSQVVKNWLKHPHADSCKLYNAYGPTEAVITTTYRQLDRTDAQTVSLGKPLLHREMIVVGPDLRLTPTDAVGELYIGGDCLAAGYVNDKELTSKKFINRQFSFAKSQRWYKTGDLVSYSKNGALRFIGRTDSQIKIRGFRIELDEIESQLNRSSLINSCVLSTMKATQIDANSTSLIVYFRPSNDAQDLSDELLTLKFKAHLASYLPAFMVPDIFVRIEEWPLTPNGKIDRRALPQPNLTGQGPIQPVSIIEQELGKLWSELLGISTNNFGVNTSFFELGGNSLLVLRLLARVRDLYQCNIEINAFFEHPNIQHLTRVICEGPKGENDCFWPLMKYSDDDASYINSLTSTQQKRFWLLNQLTEGAQGAYNLYQSYTLEGEIFTSLIKASFEKVVARHHVLSSTFSYENGDVVQKYDSSVHLPFIESDLSGVENKSLALDSLLVEASQYQFVLDTELPIRVHLIKVDSNCYVLHVVVHHIAVDGWSVRIMVDEFSQNYSSLLMSSNSAQSAIVENHTETPPLKSDLKYQYSDYAMSQREAFNTDNPGFKRKLNFWQKELVDCPQCHDLPLDAARPEKQTYSGGIFSSVIEAGELVNLKKLCSDFDITLNMLMHAAFSIFLARYSHSDDVVIGTPVANRLHSEVESLIGCFVNTLPIRLKLKSGATFKEVLQLTKGKYIDALSHQDLPFEVLVDYLAVSRNANFSPVFQIMMVFHNNQESTLSLPGIVITEKPSDFNAAKFDLTLNLTEVQSGLRLDWEFNSDLFRLQTIERFSKIFISLTQKLTRNIDFNVFRIPLVDSFSSALLNMNSTDRRFESNTLIDLFEKSAAANANSKAVIYENLSYTYQELEQITQYCSMWLLSQGINPGDRVIVLLEHSMEMLVSILAMSRLGICFIPVDPHSPTSRLKQIVDDAEVKYLLGANSRAEFSGAELLSNATYIGIDEFARDKIEQVKLESSGNIEFSPAFKVTPDSTAYILFTSGSTGQPKGVEVSHGSLANFLLSMKERPGFDADDSLLAVTPLTFDISMLELFLPLICGGKLILDGNQFAKDAEQITSLIERHQISVMQATPAFWQLLINSGWQGSPTMKVLCGGESLNRELANKLCEKVKSVWNMYGPTETTIWSTCAEISAKERNALVSVGKPIANTGVYLLDEEMNPVPDGVAGQIYIAGAGIAKGYVNRPELTAIAFIQKPVNGVLASQINHSVLYATGDLGKLGHDGELIHLGRLDHQIKLNGFRIEPGEIENALNQHHQIADSLVVLDANEKGNNRLVAYYVLNKEMILADSDLSVTNESLRSHLAQFIPTYMMPNVFMAIDAFPLTRSGKKDRKALPKVTLERKSLSNQYVKPDNEMESFLVEQIKSIAGIEQVGVSDNFFEIGMTSIDIVAVANAWSIKLEKKVSPVDFFVNPTVAGVVSSLKDNGMATTISAGRKDNISRAKTRLKNRISRKVK